MLSVATFKPEDTCFAYAIFKEERSNPWKFESFEKSALNGISLVAKENGAVTGYILLTSVLDEFTLEDIAVAREHRNKGVGRQLMEASFALAKTMKQQVIFLEVRYSNEPAIDMYRKLGFELIGERKNYYDAAGDVAKEASSPRTNDGIQTRENAYIMKKVL